MITVKDLESDVVMINSYTEQLIESIKEGISFIKLEKVDEIAVTLRNLNRVVSYYAKVEKTEGNIHFARGRIIGILEVYNYLLATYLNKTQYFKKNYDISAAIKTISHGAEILNRLSLNHGVQHKELSSAIGIDNSTLTGIMEKLIKLQVVDCNRIGKFKFYYLSESGQNYIVDGKMHRIELIEELQRKLEEANQQILIEKEKYNQQLINLQKNLIETVSIKLKVMLSQPNNLNIAKNKLYREKEKKKTQELFSEDKTTKAFKIINLLGATV